MRNKKYTFDVIREDIQDNKILIRYAREEEGEEDKFNTFFEVKACLSNNLKRNIHISCDILSNMF